MIKNKWTKNQLEAINVKNGPVLISAAAGSGKTAVLVERVIRLLTDKNSPCDADKLLIVTFTKAAAAEMKERIYSKISEMLNLDPENIILQRQQLLLSSAHISTIHSFCNEVIKEYFYKIDNLSPEFRIADENEMIILKSDAVQLILEEKYKKSSKNFLNLVETFSSTHDDQNLVDTILKIYDFIRAHPFSEKWLDDKLSLYNETENINETVFAQILYDYAIMALANCKNLTENSLNLIKDFDKLKAAYEETLFQDKSIINNLHAAVKTKNWSKISSELKLISFSALKRVSSHSEDTIKQKVLQSRQEVKNIIKNLTQLFFQNEKQSLSDLSLIRPIISELFELVKLFSLKINSLKNEKNIVDFGDLEHLTLQLLVQKTDKGFEKTDLALELTKHFKFVMVDEYQDTNEAQDMIFRAISDNEKNLFVVGDVKQSIYGFRQAMPQIFLRRKQKYQMFDAKKENYPAKIILDKNFRSKKGIIGIINFMFSQLMSDSIGEIEYNEEEKLVFGANYEEEQSIGSADVELKIIDISADNIEESMNVLEARCISKMILKMIGEKHKIKCGNTIRPVTYGDFCILLRSANKHASEFVETLRLYGIPAWSDNSGDFFESIEIITILSLLKIIDNPIQDVPLLSVLMSSIFAFTPDELSEIRAFGRELPIYFAIKKYADFGNEKCKNFLNVISKYRNLAATLPSDKLIQYIYDDTAYIYIVQAMSDGELRLNNLRLLIEYARSYEASGYRGLPEFIRFIGKIEEQRIKLSVANSLAENANVVKIMSIHKSKGLEFPICILANCSRKFNKDTGAVLLHPDLGPGIKLLDHENMCKYTTIQRDAIKLDMDKKSISEELRILYVAMTRAKEKLIMITSLKNIESTLSKLGTQLTNDLQLSSYVVSNSNSFSDWILLCALRHPKGNCIRQLADIPSSITIDDENNLRVDIITPEKSSILDIESKVSDKVKTIDENFLNKINSRINYVYEYSELSKIPPKITVSELVSSKNNLIDLDFSRIPAFLSEYKLTPAQKGSALHVFMQYANLKEARKNLDAEISSLANKGFISKEESSALDRDKILKFLDSSLCERILASKNVFREFRFTVNINASEVIPEIRQKFADKKIVLQGAIDCVFEEKNNLIIIDYKTNKLSSEELKNQYKKQLMLYSRALRECTGKIVSEKILYSFYTGTQILL